MPKPRRKILVTSALPYANGQIHIGHLLEYIQTDIWARFQKMRGHQCYYICADDAHGTAIMLKAEAEGVGAEQLIAQVQQDHQQDFADFQIYFDHYHSTHSPENRECVNFIYKQIQDQGHIAKRMVRQAYDPEKNLFLADRFIKGDCPRCDSPDQYGDNCDACGATYAACELKNAYSALSGASPIQKESEHFFFKLADYQTLLSQWLNNGKLQPEVANKLREWFDAGLNDWDISRDAPYFGFEIPDAPGKYFYVWLDAPVGYMSCFKHFCQGQAGVDFNEFWHKDSTTELYHFLGKDIIYFHGLFWPALLRGAGFRMPTAIFAHGFLTVNGQKMSKSKGTFITARTYLEHLNPEYLRYFYAARLNHKVDDIDLNLNDFRQRVNADLVGKVINIASRCAGFINKEFDGVLAAELSDPDLFKKCQPAAETIADCYESRQFSKAIREIMAIADLANQYIDQQKPWMLIKQESNRLLVQQVCSLGLNLFKVLMTWLTPVLPHMAERAAEFLNVETLQWDEVNQALLDHKINGFKPLMTRIEEDKINAMIEASKALE